MQLVCFLIGGWDSCHVLSLIHVGDKVRNKLKTEVHLSTRLNIGHFAQAILLSLAMHLFVVVAQAAGPVETSVFAVQGVAVDVTDTSAAIAKNKAIIDVQIKAFAQLVEIHGSPEMKEAMIAADPKDVMTYLKSLSIEEESFSPGRYIGKFTVRFLPNKVSPLFRKYGVTLTTEQAPATLVVPVWKVDGTTQIWETNPWRTAWLNLGASHAKVPIIVALGDAEDVKLLATTDLTALDPVKLEAMRRRYDVQGILLAFAEAEGAGSVKVKIEGDSTIGKVKIEKIYASDNNTLEGAAIAATKRFHELMVRKYNSDEQKLASKKKGSDRNTVSVAVPFSSPSQWNGIRSRILSTPGVKGVDVSSLDGDGAVIRLLYSGDLEILGSSFQSAGLQFKQIGSTWMIEPL